jgi:hypothetical protein
MARRPLEPTSEGWNGSVEQPLPSLYRLQYRQGGTNNQGGAW